MTTKCKQMNFAKVCVEINFASMFTESIDILCPNVDSVTEYQIPLLPSLSASHEM